MKLGIAARITAIFGLSALLLSLALGGLSYFTTRHFLLGERETAAQHQAFDNANLVRTSLEQGDTHYANLLASLDAPSNSHSILSRDGTVYSGSLGLNASAIPLSLRLDVLGGTAATQTYESQGQPQIVVGVPLPAVKAAYFEVFSLSDLGHTLRVLWLTLIVVGAFTTVLGSLLGRFASRRSLRPLAGVSRAAVAIAGGQLDTRLDPDPADPDLEDLTASFNAMVDQLQVRIEREAQFNSDVSHELRSPLTTLAASLEVLEGDQSELPVRSQRALQLLGDDLRRFQRMVGDLLEMSRAAAGESDLFIEEVDVTELVERSVAASLRHHPGTTSPLVLASAAVEDQHVGVDKRRFERIMANLLENAANYGGGATRITVDLAEGGAPVVQIGVEDDGPGINPLERERVFERFYRGSASGRRGTGTGTGLGLALVAEHVRLMDGQAWAEVSAGGGARFVVALPVLARDRRADFDDGQPVGLDDRVRRRLLALAVVALLAAGCAIPTQHGPSSIAASHVPFDLLNPKPSVTTTTQPNSTSLVPVTVFFLTTTDLLQPEQRYVFAPAPLVAVIRSMLDGPSVSETNSNISTAIPDNVRIISAVPSGSQVTVNFNAAFSQITGGNTELAVAQVVATVTAEVGSGTGVTFEIQGQRTAVPIAGGASVSGPVYLLEFAAAPH